VPCPKERRDFLFLQIILQNFFTLSIPTVKSFFRPRPKRKDIRLRERKTCEKQANKKNL
jgi:hypothetical protein